MPVWGLKTTILVVLLLLVIMPVVIVVVLQVVLAVPIRLLLLVLELAVLSDPCQWAQAWVLFNFNFNFKLKLKNPALVNDLLPVPLARTVRLKLCIACNTGTYSVISGALNRNDRKWTSVIWRWAWLDFSSTTWTVRRTWTFEASSSWPKALYYYY